jgi:hypothetical protein
MRRSLLAIPLLLIGSALAAQQVLNNEAVLKLVKAGLSDDLIITTINASPGQYDTSASGIIALKDGGASEKVISTVVSKSAGPSADTPSLTARPASQPGGTGTVHIYRYKQYVGSALHPSVYCDETRLARMSGGRYLDVKVPAGTHTLYADDKQAGAVVSVEPGKDYYFRADLQEGFWKGHFRLNMVQPEQGKYDLGKLRPLEDKDMVSDLTQPAPAK